MIKRLWTLLTGWTARRVAVQSSEFVRRFSLYQIEHSHFNHDWRNRGEDEEGWKLRKQQPWRTHHRVSLCHRFGQDCGAVDLQNARTD